IFGRLVVARVALCVRRESFFSERRSAGAGALGRSNRVGATVNLTSSRGLAVATITVEDTRKLPSLGAPPPRAFPVRRAFAGVDVAILDPFIHLHRHHQGS
ncbi:MAG: hypothetical protein ABIP03_09735, partial [Aquihabitans sp.]